MKRRQEYESGWSKGVCCEVWVWPDLVWEWFLGAHLAQGVVGEHDLHLDA